MDAAPQVRAPCLPFWSSFEGFSATLFRLSCVAAAAALLVACGGSDDSVRGELIDPPAGHHPHGRADRRHHRSQRPAGPERQGQVRCEGGGAEPPHARRQRRRDEQRIGRHAGARRHVLVAAPLVANAWGTEVLKTCTWPTRKTAKPSCWLPCTPPRAMPWSPPTTWAMPSPLTHSIPYLHADSQATTVIDSGVLPAMPPMRWAPSSRAR